ncbi:MAG: DUF418 domain-containing protein [Saprospiraceae bacterium]|nr:DUF418 domain-containing protein [Saprospiraceae bacterium]
MIISWPQIWADMLKVEVWPSDLDKGVIWLIHYLFEYKFFSLFSLLFGLGFAIQYKKSEADNNNFTTYYIKRQLILLIIGVIHALLLWPGDFLVLYSIQGLLLLFFRKAKPKTILLFSGIFFIVPIILTTSFYLAASFDSSLLSQLNDEFTNSITPDLINHNKISYSIYPVGNFWEVFSMRMDDTLRFYKSLPFWWWNSFAMFLLGLYAGKKQFITKLDQQKPQLLKTFYISGILGIVGNVIFVWSYNSQNLFVPNFYNVINSIFHIVSVPTLTIFYITSFFLLSRSNFGKTIFDCLAPMGKLALTNYIMQSVICNLLLFGFGFGLYGKVSPSLGLSICICIWFLQMLFSNWYIKQYSIGPIEYLWRWLLYKKISFSAHKTQIF